MASTRISGHVYRHEGKRGPVWRALYRLPGGRRGHRTIGPAWTRRGRPPAGYYTKRLAEDWLIDVPRQARAGALPRMWGDGAALAQGRGGYPAHQENRR